MQIYAMTLRLAELFEENIRQVISSFKSSKKRNNGNKKKESSPNNSKRRSSRHNNANGASTSQKHQDNSDDSDDNDDNDSNNCRNGKVNNRTRTRKYPQSNGVSSSQTGNSNRTIRLTRLPSTGEEESESTETSSESSEDVSDESSGIPLAELGKNSNKTVRRKAKKRKNNNQTVSSSSQKKSTVRSANNKRKRRIESEDEEEDDEDEASEKEDIVKSSRQRRANTKRNQTTTDDDNKSHASGEEQHRRRRQTRRPKRYESDTSFHVERATNRKRNVTADSGDDSEIPRTTRESARKKFREWAVTSEDEFDDDVSSKPQTSSHVAAQRSPIRRSNRAKKIISDDDHSENDRKNSLAPPPSRRSTRARVSQSQEDDDSNDSDNHLNDRPSTSSSSTIRPRVNRITNGNQHSIASMYVSRTTRSAYQQIQASRNDHNYGEASSSPQPNSSRSQQQQQHQQPQQSLRQTRSTIVSRHQRNADELDHSNLAETISNNRLLRLRSANQRTAPSSNFEALNGIRRTSRARTTHNYFEDDNEVEEEDSLAVQQVVQSRIDRRPLRKQERNQNHHSENQESEDSYSEEDKTPLKLMASNSKRNTRNGSSLSSVNRIKRNLYSDDGNSDQVRL